MQKLAQNKLHVNGHAQFRGWHVLWPVKEFYFIFKKKHVNDTLEIEMTRITMQLKYYKLQFKYPENITHNSRRNFLHSLTYLSSTCFF